MKAATDQSIILPLKEPPIRGYQYYSFPLAILWGYKSSHSWIFTNYIQMCYDETEQSPVKYSFYFSDYSISPWLDSNKLDRDFIKNMEIDIIEFLKTSLHNGFYIYLHLNEKFVPRRAAFGRYDYSHDVLIYGVDAEGFKVAGMDERLMWCESQITTDQIKSAYFNIENLNKKSQQIVLYRYNENGIYNANISNFIRLIEEYLFSYNSSNNYCLTHNPFERIYGIETLKYLENYINLLQQGKEKFDRKVFYSLWEHKKMMVLRISHLYQLGYINNEDLLKESISIEKKCQITLNYFLYQRIRKDFNKMKLICDNLREIYICELVFLEKLIDNLKQNSESNL